MRILIVAGTALLLIGGGFWLARGTGQAEASDRPPASTQEDTASENVAEAEDTAEEAVASVETDETDFYLPENYTLLPRTEEQRQSFDAPEEVITPTADYLAVIETSKGRIVADLFQDRTPETVNNFVFLAQHRFYDGIVFHRVLDGFMAQTGDPTGTGRGGPGYRFADEIDPELSHDGPGVLSMANAGPGTNGSQFFITFTATPHLDGRHTVFGRVVEGLEVLEQLTRIDPQQPSAFSPLSDSLAQLEAEGVVLAGDADTSLADYLTARLGVVPQIGESFTLDGYNATVGQNRQSGETIVGFWPPPDVIERLYIAERPQD